MKKFKKYLSVFLVIITILTTFSVAIPVFAAGNPFTNNDFADKVENQEEMTSKIVDEVNELREEYAKHFVCEDGSYVVATYNEPVHYKENGQWKEINNSLELKNSVKSNAGKAMYTTKSGTVDVKIPQSFSNGQKVSATNKGHTISFGVSTSMNVHLNKIATIVEDVETLPSNVQSSQVMTASSNAVSAKKDITAYNNEIMSVDNQAGAVTYEDVFNNADLEYIVTTNSIKENIVVHEKQDNYTYSFDMDFGALIPVVNEDNSIELVNPEDENETVFYIAAPYMYDANEVESTEIDMSLVEKNEMYVLTLTASSDWLNSTERAFPVVIDPTVYLSFDDVFVMDGLTNKNDTKITKELRVGRNLTNLTRTYIKPTLPTNIPDGSYINSAYLKLTKDYYFQALSGSNIYVRAYDCYDVRTWNPTSITWENQPYSNSDNGYSSGHSYLSSVYATSSKTTYSFSITTAVRRWLDGGVNNGLMLASSDETTKTQIDFHSSRASDSSNYPSMYITYTAPTVNISTWEADSQANEKSFRITTSDDWTAYTSADWITLSATSGSTNSSGYSTNTISVSENTSVNDRSGTVTVKIGNTVIGTINVTQYGADPYITLDLSELTLEAGINKKTVNISSNTVWSFGDLPDWLSVSPSEGSGNSTVEIEAVLNSGTSARESDITVTADTATANISVTQLYDNVSPAIPNLYEEDGLVYVSTNSFAFDETTDSPEHVEYKLGNGNWIDYDDEPLSVIRTYDATIYARTCDMAGNISEVATLVLESDIGEYTATYTDIILGDGVLPIGFERTYSSENGWFFTFEANITEYTNGYVFTDFYGNKQYFIINAEGKYVSAYGDELKVEQGTLLETNYSYMVPYGELECYFNADGKLAIVKDNYNAATYSWASNNIYITDEASNTNIVRLSGGKPVYISASRFDSETNSTLSKNVQYQWTSGNITKFIDAANVTHTYAYTNGLLTNNDGEVITYSSENRVKKITQPNGAFVKYTYNDTAASADTETPNNIGAVTVSDSKGVTDIWYYADGFAISNDLYLYSKDATYTSNNIDGNVIVDSVSLVTYIVTHSYTDAAEEVSEEYPLYEEDSNGNFTFYAYDNENNVVEALFVKVETLTVTDETTFEQAEEVATEKSMYVYDTNGNLIEEIYQNRIGETLINQERAVYVYNDKGSIVNQTNYQWLSSSWYQTYVEQNRYNGYGNITNQTITIYTNTKNNESGLIESTSEITNIVYGYNAWCQQTERSKSINNIEKDYASIEYDILGRIVAITNNNKTTTYSYNMNGNLFTIVEEENVTTYTYADNNNLVAKTNPDRTIAIYDYDSYGNLTSHTFNGYTFTYNTLGSILTATSEAGQIVNYTYAENVEQNVLTSNYGNGQSIVYTYNDDNEIKSIKLGTETKYGYEYFETTDANGEVTKEWSEITDYVNNIKKVIEESKTTVKDLNGNFIYSIESVTKDEEDSNSFDGTITTIGSNAYTLVSEENTDTFKTNGTTDFTKEYTYVSGDLSETEIAGLTTSYAYNADDLISSLENTLNDISKIYGYTYDEDGNITTETVTTENGNGIVESSEIITYTYDDKEQLIYAETSSIKYEYTYDDRGNILTKKEYAVTVDENGEKIYTLIEDSTDTYIYDETWKDKLVSFNGQSITYDAVGNPTNYMGNTLTWTMGRQLASFGDITYTYNEDGIRTSKTSNGVTTKFYLDGTNIIEQTDGTTTLHFFYDSNGEVVGFKYNGNNYIYVKNSMGDVVGIADAAGNLIASYTYDAWGKVISVTGSNTAIGELNPFRYRSYYYDSDIQMYYLQSRYYDTQIKKFINCDNVSYIGSSDKTLSYNPFAYCENNCVNTFDLEGDWSADIHYGKTSKYKNSKTKKYKNSQGKYLDYDGTYDWAIQLGINKNCAKIIAEACNAVDKSPIYAPVIIISPVALGHHFNIGSSEDSRLQNASKWLNKAIKDYNKAKTDNKRKNALKVLGRGLHALQDYYAHGSFFPIEEVRTVGNVSYIINVHSHEYDNPFYDWKNANRNSFTAIKKNLGNRYQETKEATVLYLLVFIICINDADYVLS